MTDKDIEILLNEFMVFDKMLDIAKEIDVKRYRDFSANVMQNARCWCVKFNSWEMQQTRRKLRRFVRKYGLLALGYCDAQRPMKDIVEILYNVVLGR